MQHEHLITMANEIAAFFNGASEPGHAAESVALHLRRFWDPRMRKQIISYVREGGEGLTETARAGVELLASDTRP